MEARLDEEIMLWSHDPKNTATHQNRNEKEIWNDPINIQKYIYVTYRPIQMYL